MNTYRKLTFVLLVLLFLEMISSTAIAGTPPPVPTIAPTPTPPSSGGYTPPSYTAPPSFQPYTEDLKSTDGSVIGQIEGIDFSTVRLTASKSVTLGSDNIIVSLGADLTSKPMDATLDINIGDRGKVPDVMDNVIVLSVASISSQSRYGWSVKSGTLTMKLTMPASRLGESSANPQYYIMCYDGTSYQVIPVNVTIEGSSATIETNVPDLSGTYSLMMPCPPKQMPASTPVPTPQPTSVTSPTPEPTSTGSWSLIPSLWTSAFGTFAIGEVMGVFILITIGRIMK